MKKNCLQCNTEYVCRAARAHISKFCSVPCRCDYEKIHGKIRLTDEERKNRYKQPEKGFICQGCGTKFKAKGWKARKYCTRECGMRTIGQNSTKSWREGLPSDDPKALKANENQSKTMKKLHVDGNLKIWNKGLTKDTDERVAQYVAIQTKQRNTDSEWKNKWRKSLSEGQVKAHAAGKYPHTFTKPEKITWDHLESLGYTVKTYEDRSNDDPEGTWYHQYNFENAFVPDFASPDSRCIIEVNGCHHHGHDVTKCQHRTTKYKRSNNEYVTRNIKRDRQKYSMYHRYGWKWALVWECEAHNSDFHRLSEHLDM